MSLSVLIVDDEAVARARVRRLLEREGDVRIAGECGSGAAAVEAIGRLRPDVVLLDVQMPELDGFGVLAALDPALVPLVVFVTAYDESALRVFELNALDYLLKPFDDARLLATVQRVRAQLVRDPAGGRARVLALLAQLGAARRRLEEGVATAPGSGYLERLMIKSSGRIYFVRMADVDFVEAAANYVRLHIGPQQHLTRGKIGELASRLDPSRFVRIHRSYIVNIDRVKEIQPWFSGDSIVILQSGRRLRVSRMYRDALDGKGGGRLASGV